MLFHFLIAKYADINFNKLYFLSTLLIARHLFQCYCVSFSAMTAHFNGNFIFFSNGKVLAVVKDDIIEIR